MASVGRVALVFCVFVILLTKQTACGQQTHHYVPSERERLIWDLSRESQTARNRYGEPDRLAIQRLLQKVESAQKRYPDDLELRWLRLSCLVMLGRLSEAEALVRDLMHGASPAVRRDAQYILSEILWKRGRYREAWQAFVNSGVLHEQSRTVVALFALAIAGGIVGRWSTNVFATQAILTLLLWLWGIVTTMASSYVFLGAPFAFYGNTDMQQLTAYAAQFAGYIVLAILYRRSRRFQAISIPKSPPLWLLVTTLLVLVGLLCHFGYWFVHTLGELSVLEAFSHITVPVVLFLVAGVPLWAAGITLWYVHDVYAAVRSELTERFGWGAVFIATAWCLLLYLSLFAGEGIDGMLSRLPWLLAMLGSILTYEVKGTAWAGAIYATVLYLHAISTIVVAKGNLSI